MAPVFFAGVGSAFHDAIVNGLPRKQDITREVQFSGSRHLSQEAP